MSSLHPFFSLQSPNPQAKPRINAKAKTTSKTKKSIKRKQPGPFNAADDSLAQLKLDLQRKIEANEVIFEQCKQAFPSQICCDLMYWPYDKHDQPLSEGILVVCRAPKITDTDGKEVGKCNNLYKYVRNKGYNGILLHIQNTIRNYGMNEKKQRLHY